MTELLEFLKEFNIQTLLGMGAISWFFYHKLDSKLERHEKRTDRLYEMFIDLLKEKRHG